MNILSDMANRLEAAVDEGGDIECSPDTAALIYSVVDKLRELGKHQPAKPAPEPITLINRQVPYMGTGSNFMDDKIKAGFNIWDTDFSAIDAPEDLPMGCAKLYEYTMPSGHRFGLIISTTAR